MHIFSGPESKWQLNDKRRSIQNFVTKGDADYCDEDVNSATRGL